MLEILFKNCEFPCFIQNKMIKGNVGVKDGKISYVSPETEEQLPSAKRIIESNGLILAPGFIDIHMHEEDFLNEGQEFIISKMMLKQGVTTCVGGQCGVLRQSVIEFKKSIDEQGGSPVNYILLTGYNTLRNKIGLGRFDKANAQHISKLGEMINKELENGSSGITFGIEYDPGISKEEIIQIVNNIENNNILVAAHYRADSDKAVSSIEEMIDIQKSIDKKFQISHLSSCSAMGQMEESLERINKEIEKNPLLNFDTYPYNAFSTMIGSEVFSEGWKENLKKGYESILITDEPYKNQFCTKEIFEDCRKNHPEILAVAFVMNEDEISAAISNKYGMIASDGIINNGNGHPRAAGTFPRILGKYVREEKKLSIIDALRKMSYIQSQRLNLKEKGQIKKGFDADLVLFDPKTITDKATYENINLDPVGIKMVCIGGEFALVKNEIVNSRLGKFIEGK